MRDRVVIVIRRGLIQDIHCDRHDEFEFLLVDFDTEGEEPMAQEITETGPLMAMGSQVIEAIERMDDDA